MDDQVLPAEMQDEDGQAIDTLSAIALAPMSLGSRQVGDKIAEPYQARVMAEIAAAIASGRSGAVLAPTGSGKSLMVAAAIEDAIRLRRPILVLHPDVSLLRQNHAQAIQSKAVAAARLSTFIAATDSLGDGRHLRNTFAADVIFATNPSLTNKAEDPAFVEGLRKFGASGGVVVIDEGHKAAAEMLGRLLRIIAEAGGSGLVLTATPFRTDGADPLEPFGASVEHDLIGVASFEEVLATGRTVPTRFDIASAEFESLLGQDAVHLIESTFLALLAEKKSIDQASQAAFARFFKPDATEGDRGIAELIVRAVGRIWQARAAGRRLAMIHCDSVDFALNLSAHLGRLRLPEGHPRAGHPPSVAYVVASDIRIFRDGAEVDLAPDRDRGVRKTRRDDILDAARAGEFDILVNVNALGVGTDVPQTDLNILACQERSIGPVKQISGRGERAHRASGKTHQIFVDIGNSILRIYNDIDAMRRNDPERSRRQVRGLAQPIRRQFEAWFDTDPSLPEQIEQRLRGVRQRDAQADTSEYADPLDPTMPWVEEAALAVPYPFAGGLLVAASRRYDSETKAFHSRLALFCDMRASGLYASDYCDDLPGWLVVTYDEKIDARQAFLCSSLEIAQRYAAFIGVVHDPRYEEGTPSPRQRDYHQTLVAQFAQGIDWLKPMAVPQSVPTMSASITLLRRRLFAHLLLHASHRLIERASGTHELAHPIRAIVLDRPNEIPPQRRELLAAYCKLRRRLQAVLPGDAALAMPFTIVSYDPSVLPEIRRPFEAAGGRFQILDDPGTVETLKPRLVEALASAKLAAVGPTGPSESWIRTKAGIARHDPTTRARETEFQTLLKDLAEPTGIPGQAALTLQRIEAIDLARAGVGARIERPVAAAAAALIEMLRGAGDSGTADQMQSMIGDGIAGGEPEIALHLDMSRLQARFQLTRAEAQKRTVRDLQRAVEFVARRKTWLARQSGEQALSRRS